MVAQFLTPDQFSMACDALPLVSIDLVITSPHRQLLLGQRNNAPARNYWFTPGGRIRKNEPLNDAKSRIAQGELGLSASVWEGATLMGAFDHFYPDSSFSPKVSTHYVNLPHWVKLEDKDIQHLTLPHGPHEQHAQWRWFNLADVESDPSVHPYARAYATWVAQQIEIAAPPVAN